MPETNPNQAATVPQQPEATSPLKKSTPVIVALIAIVALIGIASLLQCSSKKPRLHYAPRRCSVVQEKIIKYA
jgi:type IV secretion system protein VirB10